MPHAHTPGTWYTSDKGPSGPHYQGQVAVEETGRTIAITYDDEGGYNAHLIAAAPEMLERLQELCKQVETIMHQIHGLDHTDTHEALVKAYNLITRATGCERGD